MIGKLDQGIETTLITLKSGSCRLPLGKAHVEKEMLHEPRKKEKQTKSVENGSQIYAVIIYSTKEKKATFLEDRRLSPYLSLRPAA